MAIHGNGMDLIGQILWYSMIATPLLTIPLVWKLSKRKYHIRVIIGLALGFLLSAFLYFISLAIIFKDGMGP